MSAATMSAGAAVSAPFFVQGQLLEGADQLHRSRDLGVAFGTPALPLATLVPPRTQLPPLLDVPLAEIVDFLVLTGERIRDPRNPFMAECIERMCTTHILPREAVAAQAIHAAHTLDRRRLMAEVEANFADPALLDGWVPRQDHLGRKSFVRAYPPRMIHVLPGNSPGVAVKSIAHGALVKAINLFKMSSADPFTTVAILRIMADIDPDHAIVRSMSAAYWRGGDEATERALFRPQFFDRIVAWGGGEAIDNVIRYLGPGLQLVSFDPKTSISLVGQEAFADAATMTRVAGLAAQDVMTLNQEACVASRFLFVEGDAAQADRFSAALQQAIAALAAATGDIRPLSLDLREQVEALMMLDDEFAVFGKPDGRGLVIRSDEPVDFHPINKIANVVRVDRLADAMAHVNVATQTVGVWPFARMPGLRDALASAGAQRVVHLGEAGPSTIGAPHDAMYPLHRFVRWMVHEDGMAEGEQA